MANIADLQVSLNLDTSKFKADVAAATTEVQALRTSLNGLKSRTFKIDLQTNIKSQLSGFKKAEGDIKSLQKHLSGLQSSIKATTGNKTLKLTVNSNAEKVLNDMTTLNVNSKLLSSTLRGSSGAMSSYNNALKGIMTSIKGVSAQMKVLKRDVDSLNTSLAKVNTQLKYAGTKTIKIKAESNVPQIAQQSAQTIYRMTSTFTDAEGKIKKTFTGIGASVQEAEQNVNSMANAVGGLKQTGSKLQTTFKDASGKITKAMNSATTSVKKATQETKKLSSTMANVKNIVQGIVFAQTFYNGVHAIQNMAASMWDMHKAVETDTMAFESLTGSIEMSAQMIEYLQRYAANTVFTFEQASQSAKTLLAYGFKLENMSYVMKTIGDATSAMGKPENFDRIALAMGQMLAKGTAKAEELRQLMEANIPVVEILTEKLGMTAEEVVNIGDYGVSSVKVVNALLEGLTEKYDGMSAKMATTTTGLLNNIRESIAFVGSQLFKPLYDGFANILKPIAEKFTELSTVIRNAGIDGALKYLLPPDMYNSVKVFFGLVKQLGSAIWELVQTLAPVGRELTYAFINVFNVAAPLVIKFLNILSMLIGIVTKNRAVLQAFIYTFIGFTVITTVTRMIRDFSIGLGLLANVVNFARKAVILLKSAFTLLMAHPVVAAIAAISAAFIALVMSTERGRAAVDKLWVSLARLMGIKNVDIYKPLDPKDLEDDLDNFFDDLNSNITGVGDGMEDVGDDAEGAGKKVKDKFVASFDELFQVPEKLDEIGNSMGNIGDANLDIGDPKDWDKDSVDTGAFDFDPIEIPIVILPPPPIPPMPTPAPIIVPILLTGLDAVKSAIQSLVTALGKIPTSVMIGVGVAAAAAMAALAGLSGVLAGIPTSVVVTATAITAGAVASIGVLINAVDDLIKKFNPLGALGVLLSPVVDFFNDFKKVISETKDVLNPFLDKILELGGGLTSIGVLLNPTIDFFGKTSEAMANTKDVLEDILERIKDGIGSVPDVIGAAVPGVVAAMTGFTGAMLKEVVLFPAKVTLEMGKVGLEAGRAIIGGIPVALSAAAQMCASILKPFAEVGANVLSALAQGFASVFQWLASLPTKVGELVSPVKDKISSGFSSAMDSVTTATSSFMDWMDGKWGWLAGALAVVVGGIAITMTGGWGAIFAGIGAIVTPALSWISGAFGGLMSGLGGILTKGAVACGTVFSVFTGGMSTAFADSKGNIEGDADTMSSNLQNKIQGIKDKVGGIWNNLKSDTIEKWTGLKSKVEETVSTLSTNVSNKANDIKTKVTQSWDKLKSDTSTKYDNIKSTIESKLESAKSAASTKAESIRSKLSSTWSNIQSTSSSTWSGIQSTISGKLNECLQTANRIVQPIITAFNSIKNGVTNAVNGMLSVVTNVFNSIGRLVGNIVTSVSNAVSSVANAVGGIFGRSMSVDYNVGTPDTPQPQARTPISPLSDVEIPKLYSGGLMTTSNLKGSTRNSTVEAIKDLGTLQSAMSKTSTTSPGGVSTPGGHTGNVASGNDDRPILYVGTLIADDRSLKELERKMEVIRTKENSRRGR